MSGSGLLTTSTVGNYLVGKGLLPPGSSPAVTELDGGISNIVVAVETPERTWVVKQSLPKLRVAADWSAKQERIVNESIGLAVTGDITPGKVPAVVNCDSEEFVLVIERAPLAWGSWKTELLAGTVDRRLAYSLGQTLGSWHASTAARPQLVDAVDDPQAFEQLRISPYHRATAERLPEAADEILAVVQHMQERRICLVHGDFSPKNILAGADGYWVLDFEVAHRGDPDFDRAFLLTHLLCKAVHRPGDRLLLLDAGRQFLSGYDDSAVPTLTWRQDPVELSRQVACLLLARAVGKSPLEYLDNDARHTVTRIGLELLKSPPADVLAGFDVLADELAE